jgi:hypothetical protein
LRYGAVLHTFWLIVISRIDWDDIQFLPKSVAFFDKVTQFLHSQKQIPELAGASFSIDSEGQIW